MQDIFICPFIFLLSLIFIRPDVSLFYPFHTTSLIHSQPFPLGFTDAKVFCRA